MKNINTTATTTVTMTNSYARLVADIRKYNTLTFDEEVELCAEYRTASEARRQAETCQRKSAFYLVRGKEVHP